MDRWAINKLEWISSKKTRQSSKIVIKITQSSKIPSFTSVKQYRAMSHFSNSDRSILESKVCGKHGLHCRRSPRTSNQIHITISLRSLIQHSPSSIIPFIFTFSSWMRRYWFYVKNDFRKFHQILTFWDPLSPKKGFLRKCLSVCLSVGRVRHNSR